MLFGYAAFVVDVCCALRRGLVAAWRAPGDLLGMLVLSACGIPRDAIRRVVATDGTTALLVEHPRSARYLDHQRIPVRAQTLGRYVLAREPLDRDLVAHEIEHVRQWERLGPFFLPAYFASSARALLRRRDPYWENRFERAARAAAGRDTVEWPPERGEGH